MRCKDRSPPTGRERPRFEVAEIFREHGEAYRRGHRVTGAQRKVMRAIERCRTAVMGGHMDQCDRCGHAEPSYNSCRNRHCPKCQGRAQHRWVGQQTQRLLPIHYFHLVFTIPRELHPLARRNPAQVFRMLFAAASRTLLELGRDPRHLGAELGITAVLHTWTRGLLFHPHIHCVVTGGGLSPDGARWVRAKRSFLFPVKVLSRLFRGKLVAAVRRAYARGRLDCGGPCSPLAHPAAFRALLDSLMKKEWVVYAKRPFGRPEHVLKYLGLYTHRVAISNHRLLDVSEQQVRFLSRDGQTVTLSPQDFIRRFLQHVLPDGFVKIRHFGLLATRRLEHFRDAQRLLGAPLPAPEVACAPTEAQLPCCPVCVVGRLHPQPLPTDEYWPVRRDTS